MIDFLSIHPAALIAGALLLGLLVGSFLNVLVWRLPKMLEQDWQSQAREVLGLAPADDKTTYNLCLPASHCPECQHRLRPWENIPLLSYALLRGKCSQCKTLISPRYPLTELACGLVSGFIAWHFGLTPQTGWMLLLTWGLIAICLIDARHQIVPDVLVLPLLWLGLLLNSFELFTTLSQAVWGAALGYLSLWSIFWLFKLMTGKDGMGHGDFKLLALFGAWGGRIGIAVNDTVVIAGRGAGGRQFAAVAPRSSRDGHPLCPLPGHCRVDCIALGWSNDRFLLATCDVK